MNIEITSMRDLLYWYEGEIERVIDGDTVVFSELDLGHNIALKKRHGRLLGINAPEVRTTNLEVKERGLESKNYLEQRLSGQTVIIKSKEIDSFGRILCNIYLKDEFINNTMLAEGYAIEFMSN